MATWPAHRWNVASAGNGTLQASRAAAQRGGLCPRGVDHTAYTSNAHWDCESRACTTTTCMLA
eukprot:6380898-Lingulodinium_polyedra.AAC.1